MDKIENLNHRLDQIESRFAICELVGSYAVACDEHDLPKLTSLFTEDAEFESTNGMMDAKGRDEIVSMFIRILRSRGPGYHWTHDHFVRFNPVNPDRASGLVLGHAETSMDNEVHLAAMRYHDDYARVNGRWQFQKRQIRFLYYLPEREYATSLSSEFRFTVGGQRRKADYPESLESWHDFHCRFVACAVTNGGGG